MDGEGRSGPFQLVDRLHKVMGIGPPLRELHCRACRISQLRMSLMPLESANEIAVSQADLATMIGVSRQTLNLLLSRLERRGLVKIKFRRFQVIE